MGDGLDVGCLVVPISLKNSDVVKLQQHLRMLLKWQTSHFIGVLRRYGKHDSSLAQVQCKTLHRQMRFPHRVALCDFDAS